MSPVFWIALLILVLSLASTSSNKKRELQKLIIKKLKVGKSKMNEIIKDYIGKECIIYTLQSQVTGVIESMHDNWITIKVGDASEIINIDYISRIREFPRKKNGKKKSFVLD